MLCSFFLKNIKHNMMLLRVGRRQYLTAHDPTRAFRRTGGKNSFKRISVLKSVANEIPCTLTFSCEAPGAVMWGGRGLECTGGPVEHGATSNPAGGFFLNYGRVPKKEGAKYGLLPYLGVEGLQG